MMSNIVSTAAGVGIGHAIGHSLTGLFGSSAPAEQQPAAAAGTSQETRGVMGCDADAKAFTKCMDDYKGDMTVCGWYFDQLKVCPFSLWVGVLMGSLVSRWRSSIRFVEPDSSHFISAFAERVDR